MAVKKVNFIHQGNVLIPATAWGIRFPDTRNTDPVATEYTGQQIHYDFKANSTIGITDVRSFSVLQTVRPWSDYSGGATVQVAYTGSNSNKMPYIFVRSNNATNPTTEGEAFGNWYQIYHSGNFNASSITSDIANIKNGTIPAGKATQLATARTISLGTAVTSTATPFNGTTNIIIPVNSVKEAYLEWGGKDFSGNFGPLDAALIEDLGANRAAGIKDSNVKFERSEDNGVTWSDVSENFNGRRLFTTSIVFGNGNAVGNQSISRQHRITLDASGQIYFILEKIAIYLSTNGANGTKCKLEFGSYDSPTVWQTVKTVTVAGWSGWNIINASNTIGSPTFGNIRYIRLTFSITGVDSNYDSNFDIQKIRIYSKTCWSQPSNLATNGHVYSYDSDFNVVFPANVTATKFIGTLQGNATSATTASSVAWANITGKPNVATLGSDGKVLTSQLPSYVDDVLEYANKNSFPATGETGKIYVDLSTNLTWRWSGTIYVQISPSLALGHTSSTAFPGDEGLQLDEYVDTLIKYSNTMYYSENASEAALKTAAENANIHNRGWKVLLRNTSVMRAYQDIDGNIIGSTYAKKTEIPNPIIIDNALSSTSTNPVQNRIVNTAVTNLQTNIGTLKTDLQSGDLIPYKAGRADSDASGQGIIETYAKKTEVTTLKTQLTNGTIVVMSATSANKATNDSAGNNIVSTYIKNGTIATVSKAGLVKPVSVITKPTLNSVTATAGKYYQVQMSSDGNMFVNVPWTSSSYTLPVATSSALGGIKIGYTETTSKTIYRYIPVELDTDHQAYVYLSQATTTAAGLLSATDKSKLSSLSDWTVKTVTSNYWYSSSSTYTRGTITMMYNATLNIMYLSGNLTITGTASGNWNILSISRMRTLLGMPSISSSIDGDQEVGSCEFYNNSSFEGSLNGYGGVMRTNTEKTYFEFGRVYNTSGSIGSWEFSSLTNKGIKFMCVLPTI